MASVVSNELIIENDRLSKELFSANECLKDFFQFKTFIDKISHKFQYELNSIELQDYIELNKNIEKSTKGLSNMNELIGEETNVGNNIVQYSNQSEDIVIKTEDISDESDVDVNDVKDIIRFKDENSDDLVQSSVHNINVDFRDHSLISETIAKSPMTCGPYKCRFKGCTESFIKRELLQRHQRHHLYQNLICRYPDCRKRFHTMKGLKRHLKWFHSKKRLVKQLSGRQHKSTVKSQPETRQKDSDKRNFKCDYGRCRQAFEDPRALSVHKKNDHCLTDRIACKKAGCDYSTLDYSEMVAHMSEHIDERQLVCDWPQCGQRFRHMKVKEKHMERHNNLEPHLKSYHSNKRLICKFPKCQYKTSDKYRFENHKKNHNLNRPFVCDWPECGYRFKLMIGLKQHIKSHNKTLQSTFSIVDNTGNTNSVMECSQ